MKPMISSRRIAIIGMIAAMYTALVLATPMFSFGPVQIRIAEALTILPVLTPLAIWGIALGCFVANLVASPLGPIDAVVGTSASIIAGIITWRLRDFRIHGLPIASALSPVIVNAIIIGAMLSVLYHTPFAPMALSVGAGQMIACMALGLPLLKALERKSILSLVDA